MQFDLLTLQVLESAIEADPARCVLPGVKVIGPNSANGRVYLPECLAAAVSLYEGAKVKIDHPIKPGESRSVTSLIGWLENCRIVGDSIYADLHYNPKHSYAEELVWWAKHRPQQLGLSHNAIGTGRERQDGVLEVTRIVEVKSVDLVDDPATVKGLYESKQKEPRKVKVKFKTWLERVQAKPFSPVKKARLARLLKEMDDTSSPVATMASQDVADPGDGGDDPAEALTKGFEAAMVAILRDTSIDAKKKAKKVAKYLKRHEELLADDSEGEDNTAEESDDEEEPEVAEESKKGKGQQGTNLTEAERKELDELRKKANLAENVKKARKLCVDAKLPAHSMTDYFVEQVARLSTEAEMKAMIEDRKATTGPAPQRPTSAAPISEGQQQGQKPKDLKEFKEALLKGTNLK